MKEELIATVVVLGVIGGFFYFLDVLLKAILLIAKRLKGDYDEN